MKFPEKISAVETEEHIKLWKLAGYEVTLYQGAEEDGGVEEGEILIFIQTPISKWEAVLDELYIARNGYYEVFRSDDTTKPGTRLPRITYPESPQFEVRL